MKPLLLTLLLLAGCATGGDGPYPSLAKRAVEGRGFAEPEPPAAVPVVADPALDRQIAAVTTRLAQTAREFDAAARQADRAATAARGQRAGSEAWIEAQTALAGLDALRADTSNATTDLEQLAITRAAALAPEYPALTKAQAAAQQQGERQTGTISRLSATLAPS